MERRSVALKERKRIIVPKGKGDGAENRRAVSVIVVQVRRVRSI